jgi:hypothetical protein
MAAHLAQGAHKVHWGAAPERQHSVITASGSCGSIEAAGSGW